MLQNHIPYVQIGCNMAYMGYKVVFYIQYSSGDYKLAQLSYINLHGPKWPDFALFCPAWP